MSDKIKQWDEYFGIHCHLPAAAVRDLFEEIERLSAENSRLCDVLEQSVPAMASEPTIQLVAIHALKFHGRECPLCGPVGFRDCTHWSNSASTEQTADDGEFGASATDRPEYIDAQDRLTERAKGLVDSADDGQSDDLLADMAKFDSVYADAMADGSWEAEVLHDRRPYFGRGATPAEAIGRACSVALYLIDPAEQEQGET